MKKRISAIIGMGYISPSHIEAVRRTGNTEIKACTDIHSEIARSKAARHHIPVVYETVEELLNDSEIEVVHNCTPNYLHKEISEKIINAGKHLFSEKPLAKDSSESEFLVNLLKKNPNIVAGVNFNYRMNPLVQDLKEKIKAGVYGTPRMVHGTYLQDWLMYDTDYNWRLDKEMSGISNTMADIGSHWIDTAQTILSSKITAVNANLITNLPVRKKSSGMIEAFSKQETDDFEETKIELEDAGMAMVIFENGVQGMFMVSQVSAGRKCRLDLEVTGSKASVYWDQELPDRMWAGYREEPNLEIIRNPLWMSPESREYTSLAAGHPEGWNDAMTNNVKAFYQYINDGKKLNRDTPDFATFEEAHYIIKLIEAIVESSHKKEWVHIR